MIIKNLRRLMALGMLSSFSMVANAEPFDIVSEKGVAVLCVDAEDAATVKLVAGHFCDDVKLVTGRKPSLVNQLPSQGNVIVAGTIGQSALIDQLVKSGKLDVSAIDGQWETFQLMVVDRPFAGVDQALVITGSDPRGTAFGIFEVSKRIGVSPWVYWADVKPTLRSELSVDLDEVVMGPPSVKYRGIFLNDEDWCLKPWASKNIDTDIKDIGPKTYARIFELMLRLKANYVWPAMHSCTKAFFYYPENLKVAEQYNIVLGSTHCEPLLRNNVDEWKTNFVKEYGKKPGPWRYDLNKKEIATYWEDRVKESVNVDAVYTVGMRGIHDGGMPGGGSTEGKIELLSTVIKDQREMLSRHLAKDASEIPQIFCPYKEVLKLYQGGAEIPDDVTIVWADDNYGYIRKLSTHEEQKRSGGSGIYFHLSYLGQPSTYLWLSPMSPTWISYEMTKAFDYGADRLWVFNVGDIKPAELEIEFAMDLAWDVDAWAPENAYTYVEHWAGKTFGEEFASDISRIKLEYYRLAAGGRPENIHQHDFPEQEMDQRIAAYQAIGALALELKQRIPDHLQDAYFQLILYPVVGCWKENEKQFYAFKSRQQRPDAAMAEQKAFAAAKMLNDYTRMYNKEIAGGKWDEMMGKMARGVHWESPRTKPKPKSTDISLVMEGFSVTEPMTLHADILYGTSEATCDKSNGGMASIKFNSPAAGSQDLYFLAQTPTVKEDSFFVSVNGAETIMNAQVTGKNWNWLKVGSFKLKQGENVLAISQREPHAMIRAVHFGDPKRYKEPLDLSEPIAILSVSDLQIDSSGLQIVQGLGKYGASLSRIGFNIPSYKEADQAAAATIKLKLPAGKRRVQLICVATHAVHEGRALRCALKLGGSEYEIVDLNSPSKSEEWHKNVIRSYSTAKVEFELQEGGEVVLKLAPLDPGLAISRIVVY